MPRLPEPRTPALRELARQLRFQPADASHRQLGRAEELALQLLTDYEPEREWPVEWVVFRVTGYRSERQDPELSGAVHGKDLQHDLAALIQLLSAAGHESEALLKQPAPSRWVTVEELCARWNVSRQTLDRYRVLGLFSRRVVVERAAGKRAAPHRSLFNIQTIEAFERTHTLALEKAGAFSRVGDQLTSRLYRRAARYHRLLAWSPARIAQRLAPRVGRSVGAVRRAILDADRAAEVPLFASRKALRTGMRAAAVTEYRRGGRARDLAASAGRSRASVYRMVASERARRLKGLNLTAPARPDFAKPAAAAELLGSGAATQGLGRPLPHTLAELIEQAEAAEPAAAKERTLGAAYALLRFEASRAIAALGPSPSILCEAASPKKKMPRGAALPAGSRGIDWIETRLRWAARIKAELVRSQLGLLLRTVESQLGRPLPAFSGALAVDICTVLAAAVFEAADRHDPFKGGRLAAPAGLSMSRAAARWAEEHPHELVQHAARSLARPAPSHARLDHLWTTLTPWTTWLEPPPGARERIETVKGRGREVLIARLGWDARPPRTVSEVAGELGVTAQAVIRAERAAMRQLL